MTKQLKLRSSRPIIYLAAIEIILFLISFYVGLSFSWAAPADLWAAGPEYLPRALFYTGVLWSMMFAAGLYHAHYFANLADALIRMGVAIIFSLIVFSIVFYVVPGLIIWRGIMSPALLVAFLAIAATRFVTLRYINFDFLKRRVIVLGIGERAARIEALERLGRAFGFVCAGYYDVANEVPKVSPANIMSRENSLEDLVDESDVDEIVVALEDCRGRLPLEVLKECRAKGTEIVDYQTFYERETGSVDLDALYLGWFLFSRGFPNGGWHKLAKRSLDVCASLALLVLNLPIIAVTALAVKLESPGPILFRQTRVGTNGVPFVLLKFRSMRVDAEGDGRPQWAAANDSRITAVGRVIRQLRIDEIPQIFNVLRGDMSFVGPRPERPFFVEQLIQEIPFYNDRHWVKPGITGWAQLNYSYGASIEDAKRKHQYDLYYIKHGGLLLDLIIILQTMRIILWPDGVR